MPATRIAAAALAAAAVLSLPASAETSSQNLQPFDRLDLWGGYEVAVVIGDRDMVVFEGPQEGLARMSVSQIGDGVAIHPKRRPWYFFSSNSARGVVATVTMARPLAELEISRGVSANVDGGAMATLRLDVSTGGTIEIVGACAKLKLDVSTGGHLDAEGLACEDADVDASTGGYAAIHVTGSLNADASTGGDVEVRGAPATRNIDSSTGGAVRFVE